MNYCQLCGWHKLINYSSRTRALRTPEQGYICTNDDADKEEICWKSFDEVEIIKAERYKIESKSW